MDRISAPNYATNAAGKRVFQDTNLSAGITGTELAAQWHTDVQETLILPVEGVGRTPTEGDNTQLFALMQDLAGASVTTVTATGALTALQAGLVLVNAASGNITITLPAASALAGTIGGVAQLSRVAFSVVRTDTSANAVTIQRAGADTLQGGLTSLPLLVGQSLDLKSDCAAVWYYAVLAGATTKVLVKAAAYTVVASDAGALIEAGAVAITLPTIASVPTGFPIQILSAAAGTTVAPNGGTVKLAAGDTTASISLPAVGDYLSLLSDGAAWRQVGGSAAMLNVRPTTTIGSNYFIIKTPDPTTPSGIRIRQGGVTPNFTSESTLTITYPLAMTGIFPGGYGITTNIPSFTGAYDQGVQVAGTPTATQMVIAMQAYSGSSISYPITATWFVEGY